MIEQLTELFEFHNKQYPIVGDRRHMITLNPETGTLELGVWTGEEIAIFNLDEVVLTKPIEASAFVKTQSDPRVLPLRPEAT